VNKRQITDLVDQSIQINTHCFVVTADNRYILVCGFWDKSFRVYSTETGRGCQTERKKQACVRAVFKQDRSDPIKGSKMHDFFFYHIAIFGLSLNIICDTYCDITKKKALSTKYLFWVNVFSVTKRIPYN
jgi:hypothetical protein